MVKLAAKELRASEPTEKQLASIKRRDIYIICDSVLDTYNIGSIFRLADAIGVRKIYLCGGSETPPNGRIAKASVGTDKWVPWEYVASASEAIADLRKKFSTLRLRSGSNDNRAHPRGVLRSSRVHPGGEIRIVAIEQSKKSVDFRKADYKEPIAFVVGHETEGVSKEVLDIADEIVEIPMFGVNISLNVMVSLAIVLYNAIRY